MKANPVCTRTEQKLRPFVAHKPCHTVHVGHVEREAIIYRRIITARMPVFPNQSIVNGIDYVTIRDCPQRNGSSLRTDDASFIGLNPVTGLIYAQSWTCYVAYGSNSLHMRNSNFEVRLSAFLCVRKYFEIKLADFLYAH